MLGAITSEPGMRDKSVIKSSVMPSAKYSCSGSLAVNGSTTIDCAGMLDKFAGSGTAVSGERAWTAAVSHAAQPMKKLLLWSFERGSRPYDVMCIVILAFIFLTPTAVFNDRPDFMRVPSNAAIRETRDDDGHTVWVVQVKTEQDAVDRLRALKASLGEAVTISHTEPVYDTTGALVAYSIWVER